MCLIGDGVLSVLPSRHIADKAVSQHEASAVFAADIMAHAMMGQITSKYEKDMVPCQRTKEGKYCDNNSYLPSMLMLAWTAGVTSLMPCPERLPRISG